MSDFISGDVVNNTEKQLTKDYEIYSGEKFQKVVAIGRKYYNLLTWAGSEAGLYKPSIYFLDDGQVLLSKQGYDLPTHHWKVYKESGDTTALAAFKTDLFGAYTEKVNEDTTKIIEWIDVEYPENEKSDFILSVCFDGSFTVGTEKLFFLQELCELNNYEKDG